MSQERSEHMRPTSTAAGGMSPASASPIVRWEGDAGERCEQVVDGPVTIGRHAANRVALRGEVVSRRHAVVAPPPDTGDEYTLTDLGSGNGTLLNDRPIAPQMPMPLHDGDRIAIGPTILTFEQRASALGDLLAASPALGTTTLSLPRPIVGWLELPDGQRRLLGVETRIGRAARNDIALEDDSQVSRSHAHIRHTDVGYLLSDLGSANGVRVNGEPVLTPRELADGDRLEIGNTALHFSFAPLGEMPGETGFVSLVGFDLAVGSRTGLFDFLGDEAHAPRGNLREVTTLFADMHGFTALSERLNNPEHTTVIVNRIFEALTAEIVRYEGWVVKFAGDNIMAIFGAPHTHEDDPERGVKAALGMGRALDRINRQLRHQLELTVQVRVGINTGQVVYGEVGGGEFRRLDVMGPSVNLASRLEHASRVGHVTIGEATYARAKRAFICTPLPPLELKGIRESVQAYEVVRERGVAEALDEPVGNDYLIGREAELALMRATLGDARAGQGRLLAIVGDAGIGKSQLLATFRRAEVPPAAPSAAPAAAEWLIARAISYESAASYALLANIICALLALDDRESIDRPALTAALRGALPDLPERTRAEYLALAAQLLGVRVNLAAIAGLDARLRRTALMALVRALVTRRIFPAGRAETTSPRPLTIALEEMQWADSASVDALDELVDAIPNVPLLLILTYRPEWTHPWLDRSFYRQITLAELLPEQSRLFLRGLLVGAQLDDVIAERIIAQCGNNPLLLEETLRSLRDGGVLVAQEGHWALTADLSAMNMPSTLVGLVMARLDRLAAPDREALQRAAVIGRTFTYRLLALLTAQDAALEETLARLKEAGFIAENPLASEPEYRFEQALVQEIAYNNVLVAERRALHARIGEALERNGGADTDEQSEMLAYHYGRGSNRRKAVEYLLRSGERARRLYANGTAITQFEEALEKTRGLAPQEQRPDLLLHLHEALGDAYLTEARFGRAQECYEAGLAVAGLAPVERVRLWQKLGRVAEGRGEGRKALSSYEQGLVVLGDGAGDDLPPLRAALRASVARAHAMLGEYEYAVASARAALAALPQRGFDPADTIERRAGADAHHVLGLAAYAFGRVDEAIERHVEALSLRQELGDAAGMQESYHELGAIYWSRGQIERAFEHLIGMTTMLRLGGGDTDAGQLARRRQTGDLGLDTPMPPMGDASGELAPIERYYRSGLAAAQQLGDRWGMALIGHRIGHLLFLQGEDERAHGYLQRALREAERIGAREVAAAANIALGTILSGRGDRAGLPLLERGVALAEAIEHALLLTEGRLRLSDARRLAGDPEGSSREEQEGFLLATRLGHQGALGLTHRTLGRNAAARRDWAMADRHFRQALEFYGAAEAQHEIGRTLADFAAMWHAWAAAGNGALPEGATIMLQQAAQFFAHLDMQADLRAARALLAG